MKDIVLFLSQVRVELAKVVWPKFDDWIGSTIVVLVLIALFSIYLFFIDSMFSQLMRWVLTYQGLR
ncbi:MAG: preprotein translocase subunit SecE [Candidatus Dependentiae bacterium]|jgi:preprotein translocase subunit SecE